MKTNELSPYERMRQKDQEEIKRWREEVAEPARHSNYALIKINERRWGILELVSIACSFGVPIIRWEIKEQNWHDYEDAVLRVAELNGHRKGE